MKLTPPSVGLTPFYPLVYVYHKFVVFKFNSQMFDRFSHDKIVKIKLLRQTYVNMNITD